MDQLLQVFKIHISEIAWQLERDGLFTNLHKLDEDDRIFLDEVLEMTLADSKWPRVLFELTRVLHTIHQKQVVVLVDEYRMLYNTAIFLWCIWSHIDCDVALTPLSQASEFFRRVFAPLLKVGMSIHAPPSRSWIRITEQWTYSRGPARGDSAGRSSGLGIGSE
jgi:hypothetical protein